MFLSRNNAIRIEVVDGVFAIYRIYGDIHLRVKFNSVNMLLPHKPPAMPTATAESGIVAAFRVYFEIQDTKSPWLSKDNGRNAHDNVESSITMAQQQQRCRPILYRAYSIWPSNGWLFIVRIFCVKIVKVVSYCAVCRSAALPNNMGVFFHKQQSPTATMWKHERSIQTSNNNPTSAVSHDNPMSLPSKNWEKCFTLWPLAFTRIFSILRRKCVDFTLCCRYEKENIRQFKLSIAEKENERGRAAFIPYFTISFSQIQ